MALKTCSECGHRVSNLGKTCPGCGAPAPMHWSVALSTFIVQAFWLAVLVGIGIAIYVGMSGGG